MLELGEGLRGQQDCLRERKAGFGAPMALYHEQGSGLAKSVGDTRTRGSSLFPGWGGGEAKGPGS